jgi:hypothetical protein
LEENRRRHLYKKKPKKDKNKMEQNTDKCVAS